MRRLLLQTKTRTKTYSNVHRIEPSPYVMSKSQRSAKCRWFSLRVPASFHGETSLQAGVGNSGPKQYAQ